MSSKEQKSCMDNSVININSVRKAFAARLVLNGIDLNIISGQSVCICGINGVGKSTLIRIIAGLLQPDEGTVKLCGYDVNKEPEKTKVQLGVISHKSMVYPELTVLENIRFFATLYGVKDSGIRTKELLEGIGLFPFRYDKAGILSRGLLQRLAIARALVHKPKVLLADEPFTGLDSRACQYLVNVLKDFTKNGGTTVMTTHDLNLGIQCCDRVVVLDEKQLVFDAKTSDIDTNSFSQDYLSYIRDNR